MNASPTAVVTLYAGQDEPTLREALAAFAEQNSAPGMGDLNTSRLDGRTVEFGEVRSAANTLPFLADARLVIVENLTENAAIKTILEEVEGLIAGLPDTTRLIFVETHLSDGASDTDAARKRKSNRRASLKKLTNLIENDPRGKVQSFDPPRDGREVQAWMNRRAARHGATIESRAAALLAERAGDDLVMADTELEKLAAYAGGRAISAADVELLTAYTPEANIFNMVDALGQRNGRTALTLLRQLLDAGDEPLRIFAMIVRQYRLLIQMREHLDGGGTPASAAQTMEIKDFVAGKLAEQARRYTMTQLERIYHYLLELDLSMKGGMSELESPGGPIDRLDPALALEELVTRLGR